MDNNIFNNYNPNDTYGLGAGTSRYSTYQPQPYSNIILVTSLDEAIMRTNRPNCDMVYFHQNGGVFYRVKMDMDGRKNYQEFQYVMPDPAANTPATKSEMTLLSERLQALENKVYGSEVTNEPVGQSAV